MNQIIKDTFDLLTFRLEREAILNFGWSHLIFGLICTWIVGIGRYWDNPRVDILQHLGIGSVVYIFALSLFLWLIVYPLKPKDWTYFRVLTFVSLVSPPAILYAIPVQFWFDLETSNSINAWFLLIVALWRVALLFFFLKRFAGLKSVYVIIAALFPLSLIVFVLVALNLEQVVFDLMGGRTAARSPNDGAYDVLMVISFFSIILSPLFLISYVVSIIIVNKTGKPEASE